MSRLDSFIRRMSAQRDLLNATATPVQAMPGVIFELGLGNGRTYDHLLELYPNRDIYVFDRAVSANPMSTPPVTHVILGEIEETLEEALERFEGQVALLHSDLGDGRPSTHKRIAAMLSERIPAFIRPGGLVICNMDLDLPGFEAGPRPDSVPADRYFSYRRPA